MSTFRSTRRCFAPLFAVAAVAAFFPRTALADQTIKTPGGHSDYSVEIEPHLLFGWDDIYASSGYGIGLRASIPVVFNGFVPQINNSVAISFGLDVLYYPQCYFSNECGNTYLYFPVAMQWNFYVAPKWSVFGEPGLFFYKGFATCNAYDLQFGCTEPNDFGVLPALYIGGRYHASDHVAITFRVGYPTFSVGASFM